MAANISLSCLQFDFLCVCSVEKSTSALLSTKAFKNSEPGILTLQFKKKKKNTNTRYIHSKIRFLVLFGQCFTFFLIFIEWFCCALEKLNALRKPGAISARFGRWHTRFVYMQFAPSSPQTKAVKKKQENEKKNIVNKIYLCCLEPIRSSGFSLNFNQNLINNYCKSTHAKLDRM